MGLVIDYFRKFLSLLLYEAYVETNPYCKYEMQSNIFYLLMLHD